MNLTDASADIELLNNLGLTANEAKVVLVLSQLGTATARSIAQASGISREIIYQVMPKLQEKAIVEEIIAAPKKFKAPPIKEIYAILLRRKKEENRELCKKIRQARRKHQNKGLNENDDQEEIRLIHAGEKDQLRISGEYEKVQKTVDLTFPTGKFLQWSQYYAELCLREIEKRNVKIRILTEKKLLRYLETNPEIFSIFMRYLKNLEFKFIEDQILAELMIFDKKKVFLSIKKEKNINKMCWLCTSNTVIVELANKYFETMWQNAEIDKIDYKHKFLQQLSQRR
ncbi:MAG: helix-turn-helix domain-containing protein [Candidatus Bathyarchaeia archaeon]